MAKLKAHLSSRRSYEFGVDDLRLTLICNGGVIQHVSEAFGFEHAEINTPPDLFGPVPQVIPPGAYFVQGIIRVSESEAVPVRMITIEPRRIVIDVAGPSSVTDMVFDQLVHSLAGLTTLDGHNAIGTPEATRDYTEMSFTTESSSFLEGLINPSLLKAVGDTKELGEYKMIPSVRIALSDEESEYTGSGFSPKMIVVDMRAGSHISAPIYHSSAPLDSDQHLALIERLDNLG